MKGAVRGVRVSVEEGRATPAARRGFVARFLSPICSLSLFLSLCPSTVPLGTIGPCWTGCAVREIKRGSERRDMERENVRERDGRRKTRKSGGNVSSRRGAQKANDERKDSASETLTSHGDDAGERGDDDDDEGRDAHCDWFSGRKKESKAGNERRGA